MKSKLLLATSIFAIFALNGCLDQVTEAPDMSALACTTEPLDDDSGLKIICGGDSVGVVLNGKDGKDGKDGKNGKDGKSGADGKDGADGKNGKDGSSCSIVESKDIDGFEVFCGDEKVGELRNGKDGADGKDGKDGASCRIEENSEGDGYDVYCGNKKVGELKNGKDGADGKNGSDGTSCRVEENSEGNGYDVFCGDKKVGELKNGKDGADGKNGKDAKPVEILSNACNVLRTTTDTFSSMYDVFYCLRPNEKVTFILRHAARDRNNTGTNGSLNQTGIDQSTQVGQKLKKLNIDDFFYMHTNVYRTLQTARIISENKGQTTGSEDEWKNTTSNEYHAQNMDLLESWYIRNENRKKDCQGQNSWGWSIYSKVAYEEYDKKNNSDSENRAACEDALYNIEERTQEFISTHFTYDNMHKMTLAISHDQFLVPFVIAISHKKIHDDSNYTLQFHKHENNFNYWINYLTGVAIIVDSDNNNTVIPVTALDDGFLRTY
jgi:broad specificity phosphatase PhoE